MDDFILILYLRFNFNKIVNYKGFLRSASTRQRAFVPRSNV